MISPSCHVDLEDGRFKRTTRRDFDHLFQQLIASERDLVIHFHGGLVSRASALETAERLQPVYESGGAYSVFFLWNSDLGTTLRVNLDEIAKEKVFRRLVRRVAQFALSKVLEAGGGRGGELELRSMRIDVPANLKRMSESLAKFGDVDSEAIPLTEDQEQQFLKALEEDRVLKREAAGISASVLPTEEIERVSGSRGIAEVPPPVSTRMSRHIVEEIADERGVEDERALFSSLTLAKYGLKVLRRVISRYLKNRDHGLYATVVEEVLRGVYLDSIGALGWGLMKSDTADAFDADPQRYAGTALIELLGKRWPRDRRITLVGHSTGAIYIGHLLKEADAVLDSGVKLDVVFLAPACTFGFLHDRLDVFRRRVANMRVFNLSDELESGYWEVPVLFDRSLLYLVSGLLEPDEIDMPIVGMQRYYSGGKPYDRPQINAVTDYLEGRLVWALSNDGPGRHSLAQEHGDFDDNAETLKSLEYIIQHGFGD